MDKCVETGGKELNILRVTGWTKEWKLIFKHWKEKVPFTTQLSALFTLTERWEIKEGGTLVAGLSHPLIRLTMQMPSVPKWELRPGWRSLQARAWVPHRVVFLEGALHWFLSPAVNCIKCIINTLLLLSEHSLLQSFLSPRRNHF